MALQQQRTLGPTLGVSSFRLYPGYTRTSWQTETQHIYIYISPLNTTQRDTAYTSSCAYVPRPDRREGDNNLLSACDLGQEHNIDGSMPQNLTKCEKI